MTVNPSMPERLRNIVMAGLLVAMAAALVVLVATNPTDSDRVQSIGERIKCPVCQGESIANSPSQLARDMMALVGQRVEEGQTDETIIDELLTSYSGAVLLDPPARGWTLVLWLAPLLALAIGIVVIVWWRRHPTDEGEAEAPAVQPSRARRLASLLILAGAFAVIVVVAGFFLQERSGPNAGVADIGTQDLEDVSNETMEAVISANGEHPQIDGMRLALAERYYEERDFSSAFPHYFAVVESPNANENQVVTALIRLGWMAWQGNGEVRTAINLFDQALSINENSTMARYLKAQVLWCGPGDTEEASNLLEGVLAEPDVDEDVRSFVTADLEAIQSGETCA
jgi:cytochrome c-type biogenesis protein CcmH